MQQKHTSASRKTPARPVRRTKKQISAAALAAIDIVLIGIALLVFALFDHVIPHSYQVVEETPLAQIHTEIPVGSETVSQPVSQTAVGDFSDRFPDKFTNGEVIQTENSYKSANVNVTLTRYEETIGQYIEVYFVQDIYVRNIECLRTAFAKDTYGKSIKEEVVSMANRHNAIDAINSDYYGFGSSGIVIRNGVLYRDKYQSGEEVLILFRDGSMKIYHDESELDVAAAMMQGAWQSFSFGPSLLDENANLRSEGYEKVLHDPRTVIAMVEPGHYLFIVIDGRQNGYSDGMTYKGCAELCQRLGCTVGYNLDGGGTTQMVFFGELVNHPWEDGRPTSDIIYVADIGEGGAV